MVDTCNPLPLPNVVVVMVRPLLVFPLILKIWLRVEFQVAAQNYWIKNGEVNTREVGAKRIIKLGIPWVWSRSTTSGFPLCLSSNCDIHVRTKSIFGFGRNGSSYFNQFFY